MKNQLEVIFSNRRSDLQVYRGISVLAVVVFHYFPTFLPLGYLGVDLFLVISGFVIFPKLANLKQNASHKLRIMRVFDFYLSRYFRLAPALSVLISITIVFFLFLAPISILSKVTKQSTFSIFGLGNYSAFESGSSYFDSDINPMLHTWSLAVETQYYIILPIIALLISFTKLSGRTLALIGFAVASTSFAIFNGLVILDLPGIENYDSFLFYSPIGRVFEFLLGAGASQVVLNEKSKKKFKYFSYVAGVAILFILSPILNTENSESFQPLYCVISALLITIVVLTQIDFSKYKVLTLVHWLGDRSYSIYLFHYPVQYLANNSPYFAQYNFWIRNFAAILLVLIASHFSTRLLEIRWRKKVNNLSVGKQIYFVCATTVIPLVFCLTASITIDNYYLRNERVANAQSRLYPASYLPNCNFNDSASSICRYLTPGSKSTVMLLGDSHAGHLSMAIKDSAVSQGISLVVAPHIGCSKITINWDGIRENRCARSIKRAMKISENRQIDLLIVSIYIHKSDILESLEGLKQLKAHFPKMLVIEQTPVFPEGNLLTQGPTLFGFDYKAKNRLPLSEMNEEASNAGQIFQKQIRLLNIETINLNGLYCGINSCVRETPSKKYFLDADHLTLEGAELSRPTFDKIFSQLRSPK
jgi:peptidoglycan/LPS O-acetylase OafA/YrhL